MPEFECINSTSNINQDINLCPWDCIPMKKTEQRLREPIFVVSNPQSFPMLPHGSWWYHNTRLGWILCRQSLLITQFSLTCTWWTWPVVEYFDPLGRCRLNLIILPNTTILTFFFNLLAYWYLWELYWLAAAQAYWCLLLLNHSAWENPPMQHGVLCWHIAQYVDCLIDLANYYA